MPNSLLAGKKVTDKNLIRWIIIILFVWAVPSALFWISSYLFVAEVCDKKDFSTLNELENKLEDIAFDCSRERYFQKMFSELYTNFKGRTCNSKSLLNDLLKNYKSRLPKDMLDIYIFNGNLEIINTDGAKKEYEDFLKSASLGFTEIKVPEETVKKIGKYIPEPILILKKIKNQKNRAIELGNPDRFSLCYFNCDNDINPQFVGGILVFVHYNKIINKYILSKTIKQEDKFNYGFVDSQGSQLPTILEKTQINEDFINDYYKQNPTNRFRRYSKLVCLKRLSEHCLLIGAKDINQPEWKFFFLVLIIFIIASIFFFKLTYKAFVVAPEQGLNLRQRIIWLFVICYVMPLIVCSVLASQYLMELKNSLLITKEQENYKRLSEIDTGFSRFTTSKLIEYRKITENLSQDVNNPEEIINKLKRLCSDCVIDSAHLVSSQSVVLFSSALIGCEIRRHKDKSYLEQQEVLKSWLDRNALLSDTHISFLFDGDKIVLFPNDKQKTEPHKAFVKVFSSTATSAMDYYNQSKNINAVTKKTKTDLVVGAIVESHSMGLFQAAKTNISRFTPLEAINEKLVCFLDVLPGPSGEAWYSYLTITNLDNLERQYLSSVFNDIKIRNSRINRVFHEEDIRAVSFYSYATCFPSINEYSTFDQTKKQSENNSKTFTHTIDIKGKEYYVSVLKGSYLKHYLLLKVFKKEDIELIYKKQVNIIILIFIIIMIIGLALARILTKNLVMPISDIIKGVEAFANQKYNFQIKVRSENEFGTMAKAFNKTANILSELDIKDKITNYFPIEKEIRCGSYLVHTSKITSNLVATDYFDCLQLKQGTYAIISANISGNDVESSHLMAMLKTAFLTMMPTYPRNPEMMMNKLATLFVPYIKSRHIINCFIGILDPTNDNILCTNAGQPYPILYDIKNASQEFINLPSTSLGLGSNSDSTYKKHEIQLRHKIFVIYSHGAEDNIIHKEAYDNNKFISIVGDSLKTDSSNPAETILKNISNDSTKLPWKDDIFVSTIQNRI